MRTKLKRDPVGVPAPLDTVLIGIRQAIIGQRLPPGTKLNEEALAAIFGVSRTRIRAALQRLQHTGLVSSGHKQVARVAQPSVQEARELFAVRRLVEPAVAADVARMVTPAIRAVLKKSVEAEHQAREAGDRLEAVRLAGEFHVTLAEIAGNSVLRELIREVIDRTFLVIFMYQVPSGVTCVHKEHTELLDAIGSGDPVAAAQQMLRHIELIEGRMALEERDESIVDLNKAFEGIV